MSEDDVHLMLGVSSIKEWLAQGKTLNEAIEVLAKKLGERRPSIYPPQTTKKRDPGTIKTFGDLYQACREDFNLQDRQAVWTELSINSQEEITETPAECYQRIAAMR